MDTKYFKNKLLTLKQDILTDIEGSKEASKPVELDQTMQGRLSRMDAMQQQEMAIETKRRREQALIQIEQALKRVEADDYGYCVQCDEPIAPKRLDFNPTILTCINCARS